METIEYKGEIYTRRNAKWVDNRHLAVCETLQRILNRIYLEQLDYSQYSTSDLVAEGDKFKESSSYQSAISFYEKALPIETDFLTLAMPCKADILMRMRKSLLRNLQH